MTGPRKPFWVECTGCGHRWPAAYAPLEAATFARTVMAARCPMCGAAKGIVVARQRDGELLEDAAEQGTQ